LGDFNAPLKEEREGRPPYSLRPKVAQRPLADNTAFLSSRHSKFWVELQEPFKDEGIHEVLEEGKCTKKCALIRNKTKPKLTFAKVYIQCATLYSPV
jgi:hypothetical protein